MSSSLSGRRWTLTMVRNVPQLRYFANVDLVGGRLSCFHVFKFQWHHETCRFVMTAMPVFKIPNLGCPNMNSIIHITRPCHKADSHGSFMIGLARTYDPAHGRGNVTCECPYADQEPEIWRAVYFNVFLQSFRQYEYRVPDALSIRHIHQTLDEGPWRGDLFVLFNAGEGNAIGLQRLSSLDTDVPLGQNMGGELLFKTEFPVRVFADDDMVVAVTLDGFHVWRVGGQERKNEIQHEYYQLDYVSDAQPRMTIGVSSYLNVVSNYAGHDMLATHP